MLVGLIIILGSYDDKNGILSKYAENRLNKGIDVYKNHKDYKIILTGGYGKHFNQTKNPHAYYAKQFLLERNILNKDILDFVESRFTLEDAVLTKIITDKLSVKSLIIISSDFHIERVKYVFERIFIGYHLEYAAAKTCGSKDEIVKLYLEEHQKLSLLIRKYEDNGNKFGNF